MSDLYVKVCATIVVSQEVVVKSSLFELNCTSVRIQYVGTIEQMMRKKRMFVFELIMLLFQKFILMKYL